MAGLLGMQASGHATPNVPQSPCHWRISLDIPLVSTQVQEQIANIDETVSFPSEDWSLTVTDIRKTGTTDVAIAGSVDALGVYVIVDLTMENTGNKSQKLSSRDFLAIDDRGREYEWYSDGSIAYGMQNLGSNINAGLKASGTMLFDVPEDATGLVLTALDDKFQVSLGDVDDIPDD